jgi:hypothetical protein
VLEYPIDSLSALTGYSVCGGVKLEFIDEFGVTFDISASPFLSYDIISNTLQVQSSSFTDIGEYNYTL